jgi:hypothetical protein
VSEPSGDYYVIVNADGLFWDGVGWTGVLGDAERMGEEPDPDAQLRQRLADLERQGARCYPVFIPATAGETPL